MMGFLFGRLESATSGYRHVGLRTRTLARRAHARPRASGATVVGLEDSGAAAKIAATATDKQSFVRPLFCKTVASRTDQRHSPLPVSLLENGQNMVRSRMASREGRFELQVDALHMLPSRKRRVNAEHARGCLKEGPRLVRVDAFIPEPRAHVPYQESDLHRANQLRIWLLAEPERAKDLNGVSHGVVAEAVQNADGSSYRCGASINAGRRGPRRSVVAHGLLLRFRLGGHDVKSRHGCYRFDPAAAARQADARACAPVAGDIGAELPGAAAHDAASAADNFAVEHTANRESIAIQADQEHDLGRFSSASDSSGAMKKMKDRQQERRGGRHSRRGCLLT